MAWKALPLAILACAATFIGAQETEHETLASLTMGLRGHIHSQKTTVQKLAPDPRLERKLYFVPSPEWTEFDRDGRVLELAQGLQPNGTFAVQEHNSYDAAGNVTTSANGRTSREQLAILPDGTLKTDIVSSDGGFSRTVDQRDGEGNTVSNAVSYDSAGHIAARSMYGYKNGKVAEIKESGAKDKLSRHEVYEFNEHGDPILLTFYDAADKPIAKFSLNGAHVSSYWQDPNCRCSNGFGRSDGELNYSYTTEPDGSLETTVRSYQESKDKFQPTYVERYTGDHVLVEKLTFTYDRDAHDNWTKRTVYAWDKNTGQMVPIEEDVRILTYY